MSSKIIVKSWGIFFVFLLWNPLLSFSYSPDDSSKKNKYYRSLDGVLATGIVFKQSIEDLNVSMKSLGNTMQYESENPRKYGIYLSYSWLTIKALTALPTSSTTKATGQVDLQGRVTGKKLTAYLYWRRLRGFNNKTPSLGGPAYRSDIVRRSIGGRVTYIFNGNRYSYKSIFSYQTIQKRSAGSFLAEVYFLNDLVSSDSNIVSSSISAGIFSAPEFRSITTNAVGASVGYGYNYIWKSLILGASLSIGLDYRELNINDATGVSYSSFFKIGYYTKRVRVDVFFNSDARLQTRQEASISLGQTYYDISCSYQLNVSKSKFFNKLDYFLDFEFRKK